MKRQKPIGSSGILMARLGLSTALGVCLCGVASAQQAPAPATNTQLEEIVVTASKRSSTVQETPLSISAVTGQDMLDRDRKSVV